jgi:hypothetical protein
MDGDRPPSETEITHTICGLLAATHDCDSQRAPLLAGPEAHPQFATAVIKMAEAFAGTFG